MVLVLGDRRDQHTLEKLQAEMLGKINELKERTNYYITQQLIQVRFKSVFKDKSFFFFFFV